METGLLGCCIYQHPQVSDVISCTPRRPRKTKRTSCDLNSFSISCHFWQSLMQFLLGVTAVTLVQANGIILCHNIRCTSHALERSHRLEYKARTGVRLQKSAADTASTLSTWPHYIWALEGRRVLNSGPFFEGLKCFLQITRCIDHTACLYVLVQYCSCSSDSCGETSTKRRPTAADHV